MMNIDTEPSALRVTIPALPSFQENMSDGYAAVLHATASSAINFDDLLPMLKCVSVDKLQAPMARSNASTYALRRKTPILF